MSLRVQKAAKFGEYALVGLLAGLAVYVGVNYAFGVQTVYVVADSPSSMSPTMNYGDVAVAYPTSFGSLKVGDIVLFHDPRGNPGVIVHRLVSEGTCGGQPCFTTKGDNGLTNPTPDPWNLTAKYYLSRVILVVPVMGYLSPALWGFQGVLVLLPISFIALVAFFIAYGRKVQRADATAKSGGEKNG